MNVDSVKSDLSYGCADLMSVSLNNARKKTCVPKNISQTKQNVCTDTVSFKGGGNDFSKRAWFIFRQLSDYMKEKSEMSSAVIAFIGTAVIAPFAILMSPGKGKKNGNAQPTEEEKKHAKEKKFFQALRQPISAGLAFGFQMPTTLGIAKLFNYLAYKKHSNIFKDDVIGNLIPEKKYLKSQALKVLNGKANSELQAEWAEEVKIANDSEKITADLMKKLKSDREEVGINISDEKLRKMANNKNRRNKFIAEKMASAKNEKLLNQKIEELKGKEYKINDLDLVTEEYQNLAKHRFNSEFKELEKKAELNTFDKIVQSMGFSNSKLSKLENAKKTLAKEKGLILLQQDNPEILSNEAAKFRNFIETKSAQAQKVYGNKVFWITLVTNLIMVAISCTALNWLHPKFADFIDGIKQAKKEEAERKLANKQAQVSVNTTESVATEKVEVKDAISK